MKVARTQIAWVALASRPSAGARPSGDRGTGGGGHSTKTHGQAK